MLQSRARRTLTVRLARVRLSSALFHHVAADVISFAATFLQKSPLTHFVAAPFQIATAALGCDLVGANLEFSSSKVFALSILGRHLGECGVVRKTRITGVFLIFCTSFAVAMRISATQMHQKFDGITDKNTP